MEDPLTGLLVDAAAMLDPSRYEPAAHTDPMVGAVAVRDTDLADIPEGGPPLGVLVTGGAGQLAGPVGLCARRGLPLASITVALRDSGGLAGNARRVVAAVDDARVRGSLPDEVTIRVGLPPQPAGPDWLAAVDELAAAELEAELTVDTGSDAVPPATVATWIDALLDRETPFAARTAATPAAVLAILAATAAAWDGLGAEQVTALFAQPPTTPADLPDLDGGRRWCRAVVVPDAPAVASALRALLP